MPKIRSMLVYVSALCILSLAACDRKQTAGPVEPAPTPIPAGAPAVPEMKPTGDTAPAFGSAAPGTPASAIPAGTPEMKPTGNLKPAVDPSHPSEPAPKP
jgi:hypothetical protein